MVNYSESIFTRTYTHDNKKFYATFHPEVIVERENYEPTGRYLVVLLHPSKGLQSFFLNQNNQTDKWELDDNSEAIIEDELIEWCNHQIMSQREKMLSDSQ
jgi:hypothetical protein